MPKYFKVITFFLGVLFFSCSSDDNTTALLEDNSEACTGFDISGKSTKTFCCIRRNSELSLDDTIEYELSTDVFNTVVNWKVISGDIEIMSGANSKIVVIKLGEDFEQGSLGSFANSDDEIKLKCDVGVTITKL